MQQGPGHIGLNSASQQHLLSLIQAQQNLLAQYGLSISQGQQPVQHNNTMGLRPNAPPGFQQTQPHQPTFGFNGHQQALYSAAVQNQSASSGSTSQETQLPHAFNTLTLQDPANSNWNMDTGASSHLNSSVNNLSTIFNSRIYPSILVGDGKSIPVTNTGHSTLPTPYRTLHLNNVLITPNIVKNLIYVRQFVRENKCTIEFDEFGFSVKDFWTRQILLRCDSTGDLYPVTSPSYPQAFLVGQQTWHQRLGHPGSEVLRSLVSNNLISCNKTQSSVLCHACWFSCVSPIPIAFRDPNWYRAMIDGITALLKILIGFLIVLLQLVALPLEDNGRIHQLEVKNAFYMESLSRDGLLHAPNSGFSGSAASSSCCLLQADSYGLKQAPRAARLSLVLHAEFFMTEFGLHFNYFLGTFLWCSYFLTYIFYRSLAGAYSYLTLSRLDISYAVSSETEFPRCCNAVAETCWLRNLLRELHTPLATATLVYCDNVSAIYLSSNPVQHQRTKHIEIGIHFVRDLVATGAIRVLHAPSRYQYADIFTKCLPTSLFDEFRTSLSVRSSPVRICGGRVR
ncbi:ribonuclease H-like domain-containing protein [Tanacetum coccineum]